MSLNAVICSFKRRSDQFSAITLGLAPGYTARTNNKGGTTIGIFVIGSRLIAINGNKNNDGRAPLQSAADR